MEPALRRLFAWIGDPKTALPVDFGGLRTEVQGQIKRDLKQLRALFRENYLSIVNMLEAYENSYRQFIDENNPAPFKNFLSEADTHYVDLAACLSSNSHAINLLQDQIGRTGAQTTSDQHRELLDCMLGVFGIEPQSADLLIAS